ncbi:MAG: DUF4329 domain-containing protein, partial [Victivallales bacterium]|nr:DUF4329 domain-containing protein [Victivallales bacterium]
DKNIVQVTDSEGRLVSSHSYSPFGKQRGGFLSPGFSSERTEPTWGLSLYHYRQLYPVYGRWLSEDPLGESVSLNLYSFLENNPVGRTDYLGLEDFRHPDSMEKYNHYASEDEAVRARTKYANKRSKAKGIEYCGLVCRGIDCPTQKEFFLTTQVRGQKSSCDSDAAPCPHFTSPVAAWHTHGSDDPEFDNEHFSPEDKEYADKSQKPSYLITPKDKLKKYTPNGKRGHGEIITLPPN